MFACETKQGPHVDIFVCWCGSHVAMGLDLHASVSKGVRAG
jgi:hypothetical protein